MSSGGNMIGVLKSKHNRQMLIKRRERSDFCLSVFGGHDHICCFDGRSFCDDEKSEKSAFGQYWFTACFLWTALLCIAGRRGSVYGVCDFSYKCHLCNLDHRQPFDLGTGGDPVSGSWCRYWICQWPACDKRQFAAVDCNTGNPDIFRRSRIADHAESDGNASF